MLCENCGEKAVDLHHIICKGLGGSKTKDYIENLIALCRDCHEKAETDKEFNNKLKKIKEKEFNEKL